MSDRIRSTNHGRGIVWRRALTVEAAVVVLLLAGLIFQLMSYPPMYDADPDGYISYANYLLEHGRLVPAYQRTPGYPAFLALTSMFLPGSLHDDVWWTQAAMMVALAIGSWAWIRRWCGPLPAAILLGILAAPSYFTRMSVVMLTDMVYSALMLPLLIAIIWWAFRPASAAAWLWCLPFALGLLVAQSIRPTTFMIGVLLALAVAVGYAVSRALRDGAGQIGVRLLLARTLAIIAMAFGSFVVVDAALGSGARTFNAETFAFRVALTLPPAADTEAERQVEAMKARFESIEGQPLWSARFFSYRSFKPWEEIRPGVVREVWQARLWQSPGLYLLSILNDLQYNHFIVLSKYTPFFIDLNRTNLFGDYFPPIDDSPTSRIFRASGLVIYVMPDASLTVVLAEVGRAIVRLIVVWGLMILGAWQLTRIFSALTVTVIVLIALFSLTLSATNTIDARYLLPFAMFIYLAQAMGIAWIVQRLCPRRLASPAHSSGA